MISNPYFYQTKLKRFVSIPVRVLWTPHHLLLPPQAIYPLDHFPTPHSVATLLTEYQELFQENMEMENYTNRTIQIVFGLRNEWVIYFKTIFIVFKV